MSLLRVIDRLKKLSESLTKDVFPEPYISDHDFRSTTVNAAGDDDNRVGYSLYVIDTRYQRRFIASQPIEVEFKIVRVVPDNNNAYGLE